MSCTGTDAGGIKTVGASSVEVVDGDVWFKPSVEWLTLVWLGVE